MRKTIAITIALLGLSTPAIAQPIAWVQGAQSLKLTPSFGQATAKTLLQQAIEAATIPNYTRAIALLDQAIAQDPKNPDLQQQLLAWLLVAGGDLRYGMPDESIKLIRRAIAINPNVSSAWTRLATAHCTKAIRTPKDATLNARKCIAFHKRAIELSGRHRPEAISTFAFDFHDINRTFSAQLFDLSAKAYAEQGDIKAAKTQLWVKENLAKEPLKYFPQLR